jgi:hypothetical protein
MGIVELLGKTSFISISTLVVVNPRKRLVTKKITLTKASHVYPLLATISLHGLQK